jgi:hypothetical protein
MAFVMPRIFSALLIRLRISLNDAIVGYHLGHCPQDEQCEEIIF